VGLLLAIALADGLNSPPVCSVTQRFAGPLATGRWMGLQNAVSNCSGIIAPIVTGAVVQRSGHYTLAFWVTGAVALSGLFCWLVIVPEVEPIDWRHARASAVGAPAQG